MQRIALSAGTIEYEEEGRGAPVVLLHGPLMTPALWDRVLPLLPAGFRYIRPQLPLGSHRLPMPADADLSMGGLTRLLAEFLEALDLSDVTLVNTDWGGGLFLTAAGLDQRVGRMVILPCEAFDNFPPGLPGRVLDIACRVPGGLVLGARQLRVGWLRRMPFFFGQMVKHGVDDEQALAWTAPLLADPLIRRDLRRYSRSPLDRRVLVAQTEALRGFHGDALILWSPENSVMPPAHGRRLAELIPRARLVEIDDAYVLPMLDQPEVVAREIGSFLTAARMVS